jgi:hypothetical protein
MEARQFNSEMTNFYSLMMRGFATETIFAKEYDSFQDDDDYDEDFDFDDDEDDWDTEIDEDLSDYE